MTVRKVMRVGLTGGIGSGKSTVARMFALLGVPVYYSDQRAKELMATDSGLSSAIKYTFGDAAYSAGKPDRGYLAEKVFNNKTSLEKLNSLVHPAVMRDFNEWAQMQEAEYVLLESAIIFDAGLQNGLDHVITVSAPEELRIERVVARDSTCRTNVETRMANQMSDGSREKLADYIIRNDEKSLVWQQVLDTHRKLSGR